MKGLRYVVLFYAVFVSVWLLGNIFWLDGWWPLVLLNKLAYFFLIAAIPVFLGSLFLKSHTTTLTALIPVAAFLYFYGAFLIPKKHEGVEPDIRIMTYNIWNQNKDVKAVTDLIQQSAADIVALQEVMPDIQDELTKQLKAFLPYYKISVPIVGGTTALFSKYPLHNIDTLDFFVDRPAIIADVQIGNGISTVVAAHLYPSYYAYHDRPYSEMPTQIKQYILDQNQQADVLVSVLESRNTQSVILACDCNSQQAASTNPILQTLFTDSAIALGWQYGDHSNSDARFERKLDHIDYIWFSGGIQPVGLYRATISGGSDHAPVFADLIAIE